MKSIHKMLALPRSLRGSEIIFRCCVYRKSCILSKLLGSWLELMRRGIQSCLHGATFGGAETSFSEWCGLALSSLEINCKEKISDDLGS